VASADQVQVVFLEEHLDDILAECLGDAPVGVHPAFSHFVRVTPKQVADEAGVGHVSGADDVAHLFETVEFGRESPVHAEDLLVDQCGDGQVVEQVGEQFPEFDVVPAFALVLEALDAVDGGALVVAAEGEEVFGLLALVGHHDRDGLQRLLAAVHLVAQEQLVCVWREAALFEQPQQVEVLPVRVPRDVHGSLNFDQDRLLSEYFLGLRDQPLNFSFSQVHVFTRFTSFNFQKFVYYCVVIYVFLCHLK